MPFDPTATIPIRNTGVSPTRMGTGGAPYAAASVLPQDATSLLHRSFERGVRYFDTAPLYGVGESERRLGHALATLPRDQLVVSTKVGRILDDSRRGWHFDFSRGAVQRSFESSLERLGLDRVDIVFIHDPDDHWEQAIGEAYPALAALRDQGVVRAIGAGMNQWEMELRFAQEGDFDCFLLAGRYTLLEQSALEEFLPYCESHGIGLVAGGPYNSGILASDFGPDATYNYAAAPPEIVARARQLKTVCDRHGVSLKAAALQFISAHPAFVSILPGPQSAAQLEENLALAKVVIPPALWAELKHEGLIAAEAPVPA